MSGGDRIKWDYFFDMNIIEFLNSVSFKKDKEEYIYNLNKRNNI